MTEKKLEDDNKLEDNEVQIKDKLKEDEGV